MSQCDIDNNQVCMAMLRIGVATTVPQGLYCACEACQNWTWTEPDIVDNMALNWYHHWRGDWLIQYRFCEPVMPSERCTDTDQQRVVATVEVDIGGWAPTRLDIECRCRSGIYFMQGWMLIKETFWKYDYVCDRPRCKPKEPCVKRYLARSSTHTVGFRFTCSCLAGQYCATEQDERIKTYDIDDSDKQGPFLYGYCRPVSVVRPASKRSKG
ncbi:hypothetical protein NP493_1155g00025 [Ridgeia piscesae]|uniref:Uncharacterized protein n=1 Tax=Ridgeia piscesae TaxID=27915 RepID=A0AAD9NHI1_RIDPI|nr:hypothetical protein NP493_1155g00025 [Ridgeia piscesae]